MKGNGRLFVLGSGFSASAGIPMTAQLANNALRLFREEGGGLYDRVERHMLAAFDRASVANLKLSASHLADLCTFLEFIELREYAGGERWSDSGCREKLALRFYLAKAIALATPDPPDVTPLYRRFAQQLSDDDIVVTFNWDCLLENALESVARQYSYEFDLDRLWIIKLHGSVHWRLGAPDPESILQKTTLPWHQMDWHTGMVRNDINYSDALRRQTPWIYKESLRDVDPLLVLPGFGKAFDVRAISALWYKIEYAFGFTKDVYIIGLGLATDDFFVRSLFLHNMPFDSEESGKITIINPAKAAGKAYEFALRNGRASWLQEPFALEHVEHTIASKTK